MTVGLLVEQIDRNYGRTRGWLRSLTYMGALVGAAWSPR